MKNSFEVLRQDLKDYQANGRREAWRFFILGAALSIPIGVMINLLVP